MERCRQIDGGGGFSDAALLIDDGYYFTHFLLLTLSMLVSRETLHFLLTGLFHVKLQSVLSLRFLREPWYTSQRCNFVRAAGGIA